MPSEISKRALKEKVITRRQYDKLPEKLLDIISEKNLKKKKKSKKKN
jgi:hypothetical protein